MNLEERIADAIGREVAGAETTTRYRPPLVGFADAADPRFAELRQLASPVHMTPGELLPGARAVVSFFLPFAPEVVEANSRHREEVAREWALAYVETNALINRITGRLIDLLGQRGVRAAAQPATHNFDPVTLASGWSHKSVAVIAGLGSFGLHQMVITDAGCGGRFGSLVLDAALDLEAAGGVRERCLYYHDGSCLECVVRCPVGALSEDEPLDKPRCHEHLHAVARTYQGLGLVDACGKCATGPCALAPSVDYDIKSRR
jgi:epoxyqueuosine reductase QueG